MLLTARRARIALASSVLASALVARAAHAAEPTKDECFESSESGQKLRRQERLIDARARMLVCASSACPELVRADCVERLAEIERVLPTILLDVNDAAGGDVTDVRVTLDGAGLADPLDGRPIAIDPGAHSLVFERPDGARIERRILVLEGETNRRESIAFPAPVPVSVPVSVPVPAPVSVPVPAPVPASPVQRELAVGAALLGATGIAVGTVFGLRAGAKWDDAKAACAPGCAPGSAPYGLRDDATSAATVSSIGFVAGGVALAAAAVLWLTAPRSAPPIAATGRGVTLGGTF